MTSEICQINDVLRVEREPLVFYLGTLTSDIVKDITQVLVFEKSKKNYLYEINELDGKEGYQRSALSQRQGWFADYLAESSAVIVPPVILNARGLWQFDPYPGTERFGRLHISGRANIIDGQHRLGGFVKAYETENRPRSIEFLVFENFDVEREKNVFETINTNQKGVPAALSVIINTEGKWENRVARRVAEDASSPFCGKVSMAGSPGPQYLWKLNAVAKNLFRSFNHGAFAETPEESRYDIFVRFWRLIGENHSEAWEDVDRPTKDRRTKLLELTGLIAWSHMFPQIVGLAYNALTDTVDWDAVDKRIALLADRIDWPKDGKFQGMTGEYGGARIAEQMELVLAQNAQTS